MPLPYFALSQMLLWVPMVSKVSANWVKMTPIIVISSAVFPQAMALAKAVMAAVSSQEFIQSPQPFYACSDQRATSIASRMLRTL